MLAQEGGIPEADDLISSGLRTPRATLVRRLGALLGGPHSARQRRAPDGPWRRLAGPMVQRSRRAVAGAGSATVDGGGGVSAVGEKRWDGVGIEHDRFRPFVGRVQPDDGLVHPGRRRTARPASESPSPSRTAAPATSHRPRRSIEPGAFTTTIVVCRAPNCRSKANCRANGKIRQLFLAFRPVLADIRKTRNRPLSVVLWGNSNA